MKELSELDSKECKILNEIISFHSSKSFDHKIIEAIYYTACQLVKRGRAHTIKRGEEEWYDIFGKNLNVAANRPRLQKDAMDICSLDYISELSIKYTEPTNDNLDTLFENIRKDLDSPEIANTLNLISGKNKYNTKEVAIALVYFLSNYVDGTLLMPKDRQNSVSLQKDFAEILGFKDWGNVRRYAKQKSKELSKLPCLKKYLKIESLL